MSLIAQRRRALVREARSFVARHWPEIEPQGACLFTAGALIICAARNPHFKGRRLILQAGTCSWPRLTPEQDDGLPTTPSHFTYQWEGLTARTMNRLAQGLLPEMHCWVGDPQRQELIDPLSGQFPAQCRALIGRDWPGIQPPDFFWGGPADLPDRVCYEPDGVATQIAAQLLTQALNERRGG